MSSVPAWTPKGWHAPAHAPLLPATGGLSLSLKEPVRLEQPSGGKPRETHESAAAVFGSPVRPSLAVGHAWRISSPVQGSPQANRSCLSLCLCIEHPLVTAGPSRTRRSHWTGGIVERWPLCRLAHLDGWTGGQGRTDSSRLRMHLGELIGSLACIVRGI